MMCYSLWPLGLAEEAEAELIRMHLAQGCHTCAKAIQESLGFWAVYGVAATSDTDAAPSPAVRERLLAIIEEESRPVQKPQAARQASSAIKAVPLRRPRVAYQVVGVAAALVVAAGLGWLLGRRAEQSLTLTRPDVPGYSAVSQVGYRGGSGADVSDVERELLKANLEVQQLQAALAGEKAKSERLARELDQQASTLTATQRQKREAEANLAEAAGRLAEHNRQAKAPGIEPHGPAAVH